MSHLLPNCATPLLAVCGIQFAAFMLAESSLSFLGLGIQPPVISLGAMLSSGRDYLESQWWISAFAGAAIAAMVAAASILGSELQQKWEGGVRGVQSLR
jgi:ABC-type dipeptide/oligopeptide/nickel transport system permease subunit